jgi:hypothetical protein
LPFTNQLESLSNEIYVYGFSLKIVGFTKEACDKLLNCYVFIQCAKLKKAYLCAKLTRQI